MIMMEIHILKCDRTGPAGSFLGWIYGLQIGHIEVKPSLLLV